MPHIVVGDPSQARSTDRPRHRFDGAVSRCLGRGCVSTDAQETHLQLDALKHAKCARIYEEKASGAKADRPELMKLLDNTRKGDVVVWKLDRLARSLRQLIDTTAMLNERGVEFHSLTQNINTATPSGKLTFHIFALSEFERDILRQRVNAGLTSARRRGRVRGRPKALDEADMKKARALLLSGATTRELRLPKNWMLSAILSRVPCRRGKRLGRTTGFERKSGKIPADGEGSKHVHWLPVRARRNPIGIRSDSSW